MCERAFLFCVCIDIYCLTVYFIFHRMLFFWMRWTSTWSGAAWTTAPVKADISFPNHSHFTHFSPSKCVSSAIIQCANRLNHIGWLNLLTWWQPTRCHYTHYDGIHKHTHSHTRATRDSQLITSIIITLEIGELLFFHFLPLLSATMAAQFN